MAERIITYKNLFYLGKTLSLTGCLLLISGYFLHLSFAFFLMTSLANVCLSMFITHLFSNNQNNQRRIAFTWNYIGMNLGFMIGFLLTGFSTLANSYTYLFVLMGSMSIISLLITHFFIHEKKSSRVEFNSKNTVITLIVVIFLIALIKFLFDYIEYIHSYLIIAPLFIFIGVWIYSFNQSNSEEKQKLAQFIGFSAMTIAFWSVYFLTPVAMMQLINHHVQKNIFGMTIAPQWFALINSITILIISPMITVLIRKRSEVNRGYLTHTSHYFSTCFFFCSIAFAALFLGLNHLTLEGKIPAISLFGYLSALTFGEMFIYPASSALVGELIKESLRGVMTGIGSLNMAIGGLISSMIASHLILPYIGGNSISTQNNLHLGDVFLMISMSLFIIAVLSYFIPNKQTKIYQKLECSTNGD